MGYLIDWLPYGRASDREMTLIAECGEPGKPLARQ